MKKWKSVICSMVLMAFLLLTVAPVTAAERSVSSNFDAVVSYIEAEGTFNEELGMKSLGYYMDIENMTAYFFLINSPEGIAFEITMISDVIEGAQTVSGTAFVLQKDNAVLDVEFGIALLYNNELMDELSTSISINRASFSTESTYSVNVSSTYLSKENATDVFNGSMQMLCAFWDNELGENLGFGLKGLGFNAYDGYVCSHIYDHACDPDCNHCGETRETSHNYGKWIETEGGHQKTCSVCGDVQTQEHDWLLKPGSYEATCMEDGMLWYSCKVCDAEKEEVDPKTGSHSFGSWQKVDDATHTHECQACGEVETVSHRWGHGVITQPPTEDAPGVITYTCTDCGAERYLSTDDIIPGDLNGDLEINNLDIEYLLWHTLYAEDFPLISDADFNNDGFVDNLDVEYLLWYTLYPQDFPLL